MVFYWVITDILISGMFFVWWVMVIILLYIWYRKTYGHILDYCCYWESMVCLLVPLSWIKMNMPDRIVDDESIKSWMLEYVCLVLSSIDMNIEASDQTWAMVKWELLSEVIQ